MVALNSQPNKRPDDSSSKILFIDMSADVHDGEVWEMFPDRAEQERMKNEPPDVLAAGLWKSSEFVFSTAIPEIARNISLEKAIAVVNESLRQFPSQQSEIQESVKRTYEFMKRMIDTGQATMEGGYSEQHAARHQALVDELGRIVAGFTAR